MLAVAGGGPFSNTSPVQGQLEKLWLKLSAYCIHGGRCQVCIFHSSALHTRCGVPTAYRGRLLLWKVPCYCSALRPAGVLKLLLDGDGEDDGNNESRIVPEGLAEERVPVSLAVLAHNQVFIAVHF